MKDALLAALAPQEKQVTVEGVVLTVREMDSAADTEAFRDNVDMSWKLLVRCTYDADGKLVFTDEDIPRLKKSSKVKLAPLTDAVLRVNGYKAEAVEKNSAAAPSGG